MLINHQKMFSVKTLKTSSYPVLPAHFTQLSGAV